MHQYLGMFNGAQTVDFAKAKAFAISLGAECFETSAKTGQGVGAVFTHIGKVLLA